jgi:GT2 family glycosyltransferase
MSTLGTPQVSVVIPVRDAAADLRGLLAALEAQTLPRDRFEIVVGDDGSSDGVGSLASPDGWIRVIPGPPRNAYAARNRAAGLARAPMLAFCDADCRPVPTWLETGLAALERGDLAAGLIRFRTPERPTLWGLLDMDTFLDQERAVRAGTAVTANLFVRTDLFRRQGGFDGSLAGHGDYEFVSRCLAGGARLVYEPAAAVEHPTRDRAGDFLRKVWAMHAAYATREARAGRLPLGLRLRSWVPVVQPLRGRLRAGHALGLDRRRLADSGVRARASDELKAAPLIYLVLPYLGNAAQVGGWWTGRRLRGRSPGSPA